MAWNPATLALSPVHQQEIGCPDRKGPCV